MGKKKHHAKPPAPAAEAPAAAPPEARAPHHSDGRSLSTRAGSPNGRSVTTLDVGELRSGGTPSIFAGRDLLAGVDFSLLS